MELIPSLLDIFSPRMAARYRLVPFRRVIPQSTPPSYKAPPTHPLFSQTCTHPNIGPPCLRSSEECTCCYNEFPLENLFATPCSHFYCTNCLESMVRKWLKDRRGNLPICCSKEFVLEDFEEMIDGKLAEAFRQAKEEWRHRRPGILLRFRCDAALGW